MPTTFRLPGGPGPEIRVEPDLMRGPRVFADDRRVERKTIRGRPYWPITTADGVEHPLQLVGQLVGLRAIVDGAEYPIERRLATWELALAFLPLALLTIGGALGGLIGALGVGPNLAIMRRDWPPAARALAAVAVAVGGLAIVVAVAAALR